MMDQNLDEKKLDTIKLRILEMETDNIVKKTKLKSIDNKKGLASKRKRVLFVMFINEKSFRTTHENRSNELYTYQEYQIRYSLSYQQIYQQNLYSHVYKE